MGVSPPGPFFLFTILRRAGTCAAVDALDEVPTAMDTVLVEVSLRRTRFPAAIDDGVQCSLRASMTHRA